MSEKNNLPNKKELKQESSTPNLENLSIKSETNTSSPSKQQQQSTAKSSTQAQNQPAAAKRVFVPNLSIDRSKREVKPEPEQAEKDKSKQPRRPIGPNLNAARGRPNRQQNLIQSHSIFEAGPAESTKRFGNKDTNESYSKVIGSSSISSSGEKSSAKKEPDSYENRIKLENSLLLEDSKEEEEPAYIKFKANIKEEYDSNTSNAIKNASEIELKKLKNVFESDQSEKLILFQIPENLQLYDLSEGNIGKLRIRKSGKIELLINNDKHLNVNLSVSGSFLQDAVCLETDESGSDSGQLTNLGHLNSKIVCSPKF